MAEFINLGILLLKLFCVIVVLIIFLIGCLMLFTTMVYLPLYMMDVIVGRTLENKLNSIDEDKYSGNVLKILKRTKKIFGSQNCYLRYETPLIAYVFSSLAVVMIALISKASSAIGYLASYLAYLFFYFVGMIRRYASDDEKLGMVLENNKKFLKLSFLPLGFCLTIIGFIFGILGIDIRDLQQYIPYFTDYWARLVSVIQSNEIFNVAWMFIEMLLIMYVFSLPMQVIAYFVVEQILYFREFKLPYKNYLARLTEIIVRVQDIDFLNWIFEYLSKKRK